MRQAITRGLTMLTVVGALWCAGVLVHGIRAWPTAPLRPAGDGYRDKAGAVRTADEYARFRRWERTVLVSFAAAFALGFAAAASDRNSRVRGR